VVSPLDDTHLHAKQKLSSLDLTSTVIGDKTVKVPEEGFEIASRTGVLNLNQIVYATFTNPVFIQTIIPILSESLKSILTPTLNDALEHAIKNAVEPLILQINSQVETLNTVNSKEPWRVAMLISPKAMLRLSPSDVMTRLWVFFTLK